MENIKNTIANNEEIKSKIETVEKEANNLSLRKTKTEGSFGYKKSPEGLSTLVNTEKCGKRWTFSKDCMNHLGNPETVETAFTDNGMAVANKLPKNGSEFTVRKIGKKGVIYSSSLVDEITIEFELDFTNRSSITFTEAEEYIDEECGTIINIIMK
jgi:hypothetical protein